MQQWFCLQLTFAVRLIRHKEAVERVREKLAFTTLVSYLLHHSESLLKKIV